MKKLIYIFLVIVFFSCGKQEVKLPVIETELADYITSNADFRLVRDSLIACALGGESQFLASETHPVSILFYPEGNAADFQYFETDNINVNPDDLSNYSRMDLTQSPIFNGYLHRFEREIVSENKWGRVTFVKDGNLHISNAIRIKYNDKPTEFNPELITINQANSLSPSFSWEDGLLPENVIYFHAILDQNENLVSGTYTFEKRFQFYDLSNVVLNIRDTNPPPTLQSNASYRFVLMGVSVDNWVNLLIDKSFTTEP